MGTSSEDILLMVGHVRHKKNDGTLYLMAERIAWMLDTKDTFAISHKYADIKTQKISPEGKAKIQLQVVLHNSDATTFHFVNPLGVEAQLRDRNDIKELLQQLLPKFKRKVNKELEEKNRILQEDAHLFQLYRDLVGSLVITSEEFWSNYATRNSNNEKQLPPKQDVGVSAAFLAGIKPQTDGCNGLKYNITADVIESIFRTYPAVKRKHMENVPHKLTESEFWTKFFQSHYFHRDRLSAGCKDLFTECTKSDEQDIRCAITDAVKDPLLDLTSFEDKAVSDSPSKEVIPDSKSQTLVNQSMIRRFNHHSMMVLKACEGNKSTAAPDVHAASAGPPAMNKVLIPVTTNGICTPKSFHHIPQKRPKQQQQEKEESKDGDHWRELKKARLQEKTQYEDLESEPVTNGPVLNLSGADRYLQGPIPVVDTDDTTQEDLALAANQLHHDISLWKPNLPQALPSSAALSALGELSPGGVLLKIVQQVPLKDTVPQDIQQELRHLYTALCELLRHFWSCFPTTSQFLEEKVIQMRNTLERFQFAKIQPFQDRLIREHYSNDLTLHLMEMLQAAYNKLSSWQARRLTLPKKF